MSTSPTELTGKVVIGVIVPDQPCQLEEGTAVCIRPLAKGSEGERAESLRELLLRFAGTIEGLPEDMALNHDHYLYGIPRRQSNETGVRGHLLLPGPARS